MILLTIFTYARAFAFFLPLVMRICGKLHVSLHRNALLAVIGRLTSFLSAGALHANYRVYAHLLAMTSYALDFIVYCLLNRCFRDATTKLFSCQGRPQIKRNKIASTSSELLSPDDVIKRGEKNASCATVKTSIGSVSSGGDSRVNSGSSRGSCDVFKY